MSSQPTPTPERSGDSSVVEQRSIDYVPHAERHGKVWHQAPFWFAGNFGLLTMLIGFAGPQLGLSIGWSVLAAVLGACFGTFFMAFHANQGPKMGLPQMIQSRTQFGTRGAIFPLVATVFVYIGFIVFSTVTSAQLFSVVLPLPKWVMYPVLIAIAIVIAIFGYRLLHFVQRWLAYLLILVFTFVTISAIWLVPVPASAHHLGWSTAAFLTQFSLAAGYQISYAVYVSDYSRYLPARSSSTKLITWTYLGAAGSAAWLMSLGIVLSAKLPGMDGPGALQSAGDLIFVGFGIVGVLTLGVGQTFSQDINAYGAMLSGLSAIDAFRPLRRTARVRVVGLVIVGLISLAIALFIPTDYLNSFNAFVTLMLYFLIPWTAVNLVDFYLLRHGKYAIADIFRSDGGVYGRWAWRGIVAYLVGFAAMIPFFVVGNYVGPMAQLLGGADLSFVVGLIVAGALYYLFWFRADRSAEKTAIALSSAELEADAEPLSIETADGQWVTGMDEVRTGVDGGEGDR
ncbi:cytosine permease [Leifsonia sp. TF02-11]|uniref:purine-cytosine permease family protein n=1 Tax=Leifsonia sp. TF02-11 TaxID=2815212 RepID=UPI001AA0B61D|nr:cytosine permease [Leifsonia sp. TF02-11]MBO1739377.1 cytosine permease [Leifsonia sp. TF02-11]